jgi:integrase
VKFDAQTIAGLALAPGKTDQIFFDDDLSGFGYRIRAGGKRTFICQYRAEGRTRRVTIGKRVSAEQARKAAWKILASVEMGGDPQADKAKARLRAAHTMNAVIESFLAAKKAEFRPASFRAAELYLQRGPYFKALHALTISEITLQDIAACLTAITIENGSTTAGQARAMLSRLFGWAIGQGLMPGPNPVLDSNKPQAANARERVLTSAEISAVWNATGTDADYDRIIRLLMLTGARREEIGGLRWAEVDLDRATITLPKDRCKNKRPHVIALSDAALAILRQARAEQSQDRIFVFGAGAAAGFTRWADAKRKLDRQLGAAVRSWRLHDQRRTTATGMGDIGILPHVIEAVLNHYEKRSGVAGTYNQSQYENEKRNAWNRWSAYLASIVTGDTKVVPLKVA